MMVSVECGRSDAGFPGSAFIHPLSEAVYSIFFPAEYNLQTYPITSFTKSVCQKVLKTGIIQLGFPYLC